MVKYFQKVHFGITEKERGFRPPGPPSSCAPGYYNWMTKVEGETPPIAYNRMLESYSLAYGSFANWN